MCTCTPFLDIMRLLNCLQFTSVVLCLPAWTIILSVGRSRQERSEAATASFRPIHVLCRRLQVHSMCTCMPFFDNKRLLNCLPLTSVVLCLPAWTIILSVGRSRQERSEAATASFRPIHVLCRRLQLHAMCTCMPFFDIKHLLNCLQFMSVVLCLPAWTVIA